MWIWVKEVGRGGGEVERRLVERFGGGGAEVSQEETGNELIAVRAGGAAVCFD